jgi:hypothetical protein
MTACTNRTHMMFIVGPKLGCTHAEKHLLLTLPPAW